MNALILWPYNSDKLLLIKEISRQLTHCHHISLVTSYFLHSA